MPTHKGANSYKFNKGNVPRQGQLSYKWIHTFTNTTIDVHV